MQHMAQSRKHPFYLGLIFDNLSIEEHGTRGMNSESEPGSIATGFFTTPSKGRLKAVLKAPPKRSREGGLAPALF
jgi:hypothetical protein